MCESKEMKEYIQSRKAVNLYVRSRFSGGMRSKVQGYLWDYMWSRLPSRLWSMVWGPVSRQVVDHVQNAVENE